MKFSIPSKDLVTAVTSITKITGCKHISIYAEDGKLTLSGFERGRSMRKTLQVDVEEEGGVTVMPDVLIGVIKGRTQLTVELCEDSHVKVRSGSYSATIKVLPYEEVEIAAPESEQELSFVESELSALLDACNRASLSAPYLEGSPALPLLVRISEKGTHVAALDNHHASSVRTKFITLPEPVELLIPATALSTLSSVSSGSQFRVILAENALYADNSSFALLLPMEQVSSSGLGLAVLNDLIKRVKAENNVTEVSVKYNDLKNILDNVTAVSEPGVPLSLEVSGNTLKVGTETQYGSALEELACSTSGNNVSVKLHTAMFLEMLDKVRASSVSIHILPNLIYLQNTSSTVACLYSLSRTA